MTFDLSLVTLVVRDYDEALGFFVGILGFTLVEDRPVPEQGKRWVVIAPGGADGRTHPGGARILLARASSVEQTARIGDQTGGRVAFFLTTDDLARDAAAWRARGVVFVREPSAQPHGQVAVFRDLYGNMWDLIQPAAATPR